MSFKKSDIITESKEHFDHYEITVDPKQEPLRIDVYLQSKMVNGTRSKIQAGCKEGNILVNDKQIKPNYKVRPLDKIVATMGKPPNYSKELIAEDIPLDVIYEDEDLIVINKQAGLVVHPGVGNYTGTLVNGLIHYFKSKELPVMEGNEADRPGLVHRIDKDTSGLMVIAKSEVGMAGLAKQFYDHTIDREYLALVWGDVEESTGTITGHIGRHPQDRTKQHVYEDGDEGKHATTHYTVEEALYYVTLVKCVLETGRTHQIRVHMQYLGHPLFGDAKYGGDRILKGTVFSKYRQFVENTFAVMPRQSLHARSLGFVHPVSGEKMHFEAELPEDFTAALDRWRSYTASRKDISQQIQSDDE